MKKFPAYNGEVLALCESEVQDNTVGSCSVSNLREEVIVNQYQFVLFLTGPSSTQLVMESYNATADSDEEAVQKADALMKELSKNTKIVKALIVSRIVKIFGDPNILTQAANAHNN